MLPIEAITQRFHDLIAVAFTEYSGRIHLNRTVPFDDEMGEIPGINVSQGDDVPNNNLATLDGAGWIASVTVTCTLAGSSNQEHELVRQLNTMRLRTHRAIMDDRKIGFDWVMEVAPGPVQPILSDSPSSRIIKELSMNWQALYIADRRNPDVIYP